MAGAQKIAGSDFWRGVGDGTAGCPPKKWSGTKKTARHHWPQRALLVYSQRRPRVIYILF
jgi:hypothetical protein